MACGGSFYLQDDPVLEGTNGAGVATRIVVGTSFIPFCTPSLFWVLNITMATLGRALARG